MICSWLKHHLFFKKTFSLIALFAFIMTFVLMDAWAEAADASVITTPDKTEEHLQLDVDTLTISPHIGTVKFSRKGKSDKTIIHIQDAHCNYGAQKSISKIIEYLNTEYGIEYINLEGGAGDYDLSVFTDISNRAIRSRVADYFMKWGQVNGAEFYALSNPDKVTLWGVEEPDLYLKNLNIYRESLDYKEDANRHLRELKYFINNLKRHIFPKELLELDIKYTQYKARNLKFKDYLIFLLSKARQEGIDIRLYPNIYLLSQSLKEEDKIDFQKANKERDRLIDELQQVLSKRELKELAAKT